MPTEAERQRIARDASKVMSKKFAEFLDQINRDMASAGLTNSEVRDQILVAVAPVVMDMSMKGIFK